MIEGRYAAESNAEVMGEGGGGSRRREGSAFSILKEYRGGSAVNP